MSEDAQRDSERVGGPASGVPARGYSWEPFGEGNSVAVRHGSYAVLHLKPRAAEIAGWLREHSPVWREEFGPLADTTGMVAAQFEKAMAALAQEEDASKHAQLDQRAHRWAKLLVQCLGTFGLTPASMARLGLDLAVTRRGAAAADYLESKRAREAAEREAGEGGERDGA